MAGTRFVVPFGREGAADRAARAFAAALGWPPAIENLPGAGGLKGVERANALAAGGAPVLILATPSTHVLLPARLGAHAAPHAAFLPMRGLGAAPNVLLASPRLGLDSVAALVERARRERLTYASAGAGQTIHACTALFCVQAGIAMEHRPYEGGSVLAYGDLAAGRVHVYFDNLLGCRDRIASGEAVPLAVSSAARHPLLAGVPALRECGFGEYDLDVWLGVFAAHAPVDAPVDAGLAQALAALGLGGGPLAPAAFARQVEASQGAWRRALEAAERGCPPSRE